MIAQPKRVALLAYLRLAGEGRPVTRDAVLGMFWPEVPEDRALNSLRQSLHFLRRSLGEHVVERPGDHLLRIPPDNVWCDAVELERLVDAGEYDQALALYRGPFLAGLPIDGPHALEEWIEATRRSYSRLAVRAATELVEESLERGLAVRAADGARRLIELDPLSERGTALLIDAHALGGDRVAALRAFQEYETALRLELDLSPSEELRQRVEELRSREQADVQDRPKPEASTIPEPTAEGSIVAESEAHTDTAMAETASASGGVPDASPWRRRMPALGLGAVVAGVAMLSLVWTGEEREGPTRASSWMPALSVGDRPSVAVLPFINLSDDDSNAFFAGGVHESVIVTLSKIGALDVSGLQAVRAYAGTSMTHTEIGEELGVSALMSGSVQRAGDRVRIIVELVDSRSGTQLWSEAFDRRLDDVFAVQSEIATSVATSLSAAMTSVERDRIAKRPTESLEALDMYMRGREAYRRLSLDAMNEAIGFYEASVAADSGFAPGWAGVADALLQRVQFFGYPLIWADSARILVERATRLDPELPEAYKTLGFVHSAFGREQAALNANRRALELRPAYAEALNNAGWSLYYLGELSEAERLIARAFRLQPTIPQLRSNVGAIWAALGRVDEAGAWLDGVLDTSPGLTAARNWRVFVDHERADPDAALERARRYLEDEVPLTAAYARAAYAALLARDFRTALEFSERVGGDGAASDPFSLRRIETVRGMALIQEGAGEEGARAARASIASVNRAVAGGADGWDPAWELAAANGVIGDPDETLRHLTAAVERGFPHAVLLRLDPSFDLVRTHPSFEALIGRVETRAELQRRESLEM